MAGAIQLKMLTTYFFFLTLSFAPDAPFLDHFVMNKYDPHLLGIVQSLSF